MIPYNAHIKPHLLRAAVFSVGIYGGGWRDSRTYSNNKRSLLNWTATGRMLGARGSLMSIKINTVIRRGVSRTDLLKT